MTSYAVQGATYETSTSRIDEHASRSEAYVDITRGRHANHLFLTRGPEQLDGEHLPKIPPPPVAEAVANRLRNSGPERPAIELDPHAAALATSGPELAAIDQPRITTVRARLLAPHDPPQRLVRGLPDPSEVPFLRRKWIDALVEVTAFTAISPSLHDGPYAWAHGGSGPAPSDDWLRVTRVLDDLAVADAAERLRILGLNPPDDWLLDHCRARLAAGNGRWEPNELDDLVTCVAAGRAAPSLADPSPGLGPLPSDPAEAAAHRLLAYELDIATDTRDQSRGLG